MRPGSLMRNVVVGPILDEHVATGCEVLDLGGYDGAVTAGLRDKGARITVVDLDEAGLTVARARGLEAVCAPAQSTPFADRTFDVVVCCDLLPSVPRDVEQPIFSEIARVLKPDGLLILTVPDADLHMPFVDMADVYEIWRAREGVSRDRLWAMAASAGLEVCDSREYFGLSTRIYYSLAFLRNLPRRGTRLKRRIWRYLVAGESWWCLKPQAHLIVARRRGAGAPP
jgi:SAM-dependent methyltransferase